MYFYRENRMFLEFLAENRFLPTFCVYFKYFEVALTLCHHSDVTR